MILTKEVGSWAGRRHLASTACSVGSRQLKLRSSSCDLMDQTPIRFASGAQTFMAWWATFCTYRLCTMEGSCLTASAHSFISAKATLSVTSRALGDTCESRRLIKSRHCGDVSCGACTCMATGLSCPNRCSRNDAWDVLFT